VAQEQGDQQGLRSDPGPEAAGEAVLQGAEEGAPGGAAVRGSRLAEAAEDGACNPHARGRRLPVSRGEPCCRASCFLLLHLCEVNHVTHSLARTYFISMLKPIPSYKW
jgi:hypothetical protein